MLDQWADTATVAVTVRDQDGQPVDNASLAWVSLDTAVVRVEASGRLESAGLGSATVRVTASHANAVDVHRDLTVRVMLQRNAACTLPTGPGRGAATSAISFGPAQILSLPAVAHDGGRSLPADYDGDGDTDIVRLEYSYPSSATYTGRTTIFRNDAGTLVDATTAVLPGPVVPDHPRDFEIADFTGDGVADLYVAQHGYDAAPFPGAPNLFLTRRNGQLVDEFSSRFSPASNVGFSHGSSAADVDCDGDQDIVELNANDNAPHYLFLNDGSGGFTAASPDAFPIGGGGVRWQEVSFIDFDADG
ncbi:MAG TPA: FG-GAP-like repeat-containing protein, partial [Longimicrobiaceae bacterium]